MQGPLYSNNPLSHSKIAVDINIKSPVILKPEVLTYNSVYHEIPRFQVLCMNKEEILAEKIRALSLRQRSRDLFDIYFLMQNKVHLNIDLIEKKMEYYKTCLDTKKLVYNINGMKRLWENEIKRLVFNPPEFDMVKKEVEKEIKLLK